MNRWIVTIVIMLFAMPAMAGNLPMPHRGTAVPTSGVVTTDIDLDGNDLKNVNELQIGVYLKVTCSATGVCTITDWAGQGIQITLSTNGLLTLNDEADSDLHMQVEGRIRGYRTLDATSDGDYLFKLDGPSAFEFTAATGTQYGISLKTEIAQGGGTAAFIANYIAITDTSSGSGQDYLAYWDWAADASPEFTVEDDGDTYIGGVLKNGTHTETIADNGGGTNATATLTPSANFIVCDCDDANGCDITMGETGMAPGMRVTIVGETGVTCEFTDTDGVSNLTGALSMGDDDTLELVYSVDEWVEVSRSNN